MTIRTCINNIVLALLFLLPYGTMAQEATFSTGGDFGNSDGSISYSIGQVFFSTQNTSESTIVQGVQQPYEISILTSSQVFKPALNISVFPNPTIHSLIVEIPEGQTDLSAQLLDAKGQLLEFQALQSQQTTFKIDSFPAGIYFLKITQHDQFVQTYKFIKH